jgi:hypothetical protein
MKRLAIVVLLLVFVATAGAMPSTAKPPTGKSIACAKLESKLLKEISQLVAVGCDADGDEVPDVIEDCPEDPLKAHPGVCGCGTLDTDSDGDGTPHCFDGCPDDPAKIAPSVCGCGMPDTDIDGDRVLDCLDGCPDDPDKIDPGACGCGVPDTDSDGDGTPDCLDGCPDDPDKTEPGVCGCGVPDTDSDGDGTPDCLDGCPDDPDKTEPGICGCGVPDSDSDGDGTLDCLDGCPDDPDKTEPGICGCGVPDTDSDGDGTPDCLEGVCGLWPLTLHADTWALHSGGEGCGLEFYVWAGDNENNNPDCSIFDCDVNGDGILDVVDIGNRGWLDYADVVDPELDPCAQTGCGEAELECWIANGHTGPLDTPACIPGVQGVKAGVADDVNSRIGEMIPIPIYDSVGCVSARSCPGGATYEVGGFGCITVLGWIHEMRLPRLDGANPPWAGKMIGAVAACGAECDESCGNTP